MVVDVFGRKKDAPEVLRFVRKAIRQTEELIGGEYLHAV
jgi:hypothetical protein